MINSPRLGLTFSFLIVGRVFIPPASEDTKSVIPTKMRDAVETVCANGPEKRRIGLCRVQSRKREGIQDALSTESLIATNWK